MDRCPEYRSREEKADAGNHRNTKFPRLGDWARDLVRLPCEPQRSGKMLVAPEDLSPPGSPSSQHTPHHP